MSDQGSGRAWGEDLAQHAGWVRRLARQLVRDEHLAEDVAGDVLLAAVRASALPAEGGPRRSWLRAVTRNVARGRTARESQRRDVEAQAAPGPTPSAPDDDLQRLQVVQRLARALQELDEPYRSTRVLRFFDDLPPR